jgi:PAS domain S-box-containing protein
LILIFVRCKFTRDRNFYRNVQHPIYRREKHCENPSACPSISRLVSTGELLLSLAAYDMPTVLVVHEGSDIHHLVESALAGHFHVVLAANESEALVQVGRWPVDLVICDAGLQKQYSVLMQRLSGHENLNRMALLVLLNEDESPAPLALEEIEQDYIFQPLRPAELLIRCNKLLAMMRSIEQLAAQAQERGALLEQSEHRFRLMVESIEDHAMFMVDPQGFITSWNRGAERVTGYTEAEAIGRQFSMLYPRENLTAAHAHYELAMARSKGLHEEEGLRLRKDGSMYYAQVLVWPVKDHQGEVVGFAKITRDITTRRQAEQAIKESEAKFRTITDAMPQMVWSTLPNGDHDYFNKQWYDFTGVPVGTTNGAGWNLILHPDDQGRALKVWQDSLRTGETYEVQYRLRHHSGIYRWTLGRALPVRNDEGVIVRWMGTLTDIHKQKESEEALKDDARRKDDFLAMLAHELRNPLAPVRNSTFLLNRLIDQSNDRAIQAVNVIDRQVRHMTCLIDDLLDVARISRGKIKIRREVLDIVEVVVHATEDFEADYYAKDVRLKTVLHSPCLSIAGDRTRVAEVIGNLLHNALKFTETAGAVMVEVDRECIGDAEMAVVRVSDSGIGIAPDIIATLFHPFIQADQGLARSRGGLGLGLALVKGFMELHGGSVEARSEGLGHGSSFILRFPLIQARSASIAETRPASHVHPLRVLLIEDNPDMRETLQEVLSLHGHEVFTAADGVSGLDQARATKPDLVLCDIGLPGEYDGFEVARLIRTDPELVDVYLVALSGYGQEQDLQRAKQSGFDRHLLKPLNFTELATVMADASSA